MKALRFRLPLNSNSELKKTELLSAVPSELAPLPQNLGRIEANNSISEGLRLLLAPPPDFPTFLRLTVSVFGHFCPKIIFHVKKQ